MRRLSVAGASMMLTLGGVSACGASDRGGNDHGNGDETATAGDGTTTTSPPEPIPVMCPDFDLGALTQASVSGDTTGAPGLRAADCGGRAAPEHVYAWTAPEVGIYELSVEADYDAVLYLLQGNCEGLVVGCIDDDAESDLAPRLLLNVLEANSTWMVVVDGQGSATDAYGEYTLTIDPFELSACPSEDLGSALPVKRSYQSGETLVDTDVKCGTTRAEVVYTWTAPQAGTYVFEATSEPVLAPRLVVTDAVCAGDVLACSTGPTVLDLMSGQSVGIELAQLGPYDGLVELSIDTFVCPTIDLGSAIPVMTTGTIDPAMATLSASCGGAGGELVYTWTAPTDGDFLFSTAGSAGDTVLYVQEGTSCGGPLLACNDDASSTQETSEATLTLVSGQAVTVVVDALAQGQAFDIALAISEVP